jgi:hypothetical protein
MKIASVDLSVNVGETLWPSDTYGPDRPVGSNVPYRSKVSTVAGSDESVAYR